MTTSIDEIRRFVLFIANKSQAGINPTPEEFNLAAKRAQIQWITDRYNTPAQYRYDKEEPRVAWEQSQKISDDLKFLLEKVTLNPDPDGKISYPSDYLHLSSIRANYSKMKNDEVVSFEVDVKIFRDAEIGNILSSQIVEPTKRYPAGVIYQDYIQVYPKDTNPIVFTYLREPTVPKWEYTLVNNRPVYDAGASVDFEVPEDSLNEIVVRILSFLGIFIREPQLHQYAETMKQQGI